MKIVKIEINEFGPLKSRTFEFSDGLTLINGDNESGKSTLLLFIKYMLYGIAKKPKGSIVCEADRAISRISDTAGGSMTVLHKGRLYRIERMLGRTPRGGYSDRVQLRDAQSGERIGCGSAPGEELLGIPYEVFESSCLISQLGCSSVNGVQLGEAMRNLLSSADESVNAEKALKNLESIRIKYLHKDEKGGYIAELRKSKSELERKYRTALEESVKTDELKADIERIDKRLAEVVVKQRRAEDLSTKIEQRTVLKLFDKLHEYESLYDVDKKALRELEGQFDPALEPPSRVYLAELTSTRAELRLSSEEYNKTCALLEDKKGAGLPKESRELLEKVRKAGGIDGLRAKADQLKRSAKSAGTISVIMLILAALSAVIGFLPIAAITIAISLLIPSLSAAVIFILASLFFLIKSLNKKKAYSGLPADFGAEKEKVEDFFAGVETLMREESEYQRELASQSEAIVIKERMLHSAIEKSVLLLEKYEKVYVHDAEDTDVRLSSAIEMASDFCTESERLKAELESLKNSIDGLSFELADYNEHKLRRQVPDGIMAMSEDEIREAKKEKSYYDLQIKALNERRVADDRALLERKFTTEDPFVLAASISEVSKKLEDAENIFTVVTLAISALSGASANLRGTVAPKIRSGASGYMEILSGGKYGDIFFDDELQMSMDEQGFSYPIDSFSTGTRDAAYLSMRLALLKLLPCDETAPLFMDETLAMVDDKRAARILDILAHHTKDGSQCILFSCHDREKRLCDENGIAFNAITMK